MDREPITRQAQMSYAWLNVLIIISVQCGAPPVISWVITHINTVAIDITNHIVIGCYRS